MTEPDFQIPADSLPEGFAENVDRPPDSPVAPRPAATVVLLRPSDRGPEVLLLRRNRTVGFVPGAYVFPGGRVETDDAAPEVLAHVQGLSVEQAAGPSRRRGSSLPRTRPVSRRPARPPLPIPEPPRSSCTEASGRSERFSPLWTSP
jgi:hypothetical protein